MFLTVYNNVKTQIRAKRNLLIYAFAFVRASMIPFFFHYSIRISPQIPQDETDGQST